MIVKKNKESEKWYAGASNIQDNFFMSYFTIFSSETVIIYELLKVTLESFIIKPSACPKKCAQVQTVVF